MKTVKHQMYELEIEDIKRLIAEATEKDGVNPIVIGDDNWPRWIGAAKVHLQRLVSSAESQK